MQQRMRTTRTIPTTTRPAPPVVQGGLALVHTLVDPEGVGAIATAMIERRRNWKAPWALAVEAKGRTPPMACTTPWCFAALGSAGQATPLPQAQGDPDGQRAVPEAEVGLGAGFVYQPGSGTAVAWTTRRLRLLDSGPHLAAVGTTMTGRTPRCPPPLPLPIGGWLGGVPQAPHQASPRVLCPPEAPAALGVLAVATPHPMTRTLGRTLGGMGQQWVMVEGPWQSLCLACPPSPEAPAGPCVATARGAVALLFGGVVVAAAAAVVMLWPALPLVPVPGGPSLGVEARRGRQTLRRIEPVLGPPAVVVVVEEVVAVVLVLVPACRVPGGLVGLGLQVVQRPAVRGGSSGGLS